MYNFKESQRRNQANAAATAYVCQSGVAPDSPSPRFSQNDAGSVENYGTRGGIEA